MLNICFHEKAKHLFDTETTDILLQLVREKEKNFKAPTYLILSDIKPELTAASTLLAKISAFDYASPQDINVILHRVRELTNESESISSELLEQIQSKQTKARAFASYLRQVYAFGCWQFLTQTETEEESWLKIMELAQERLVLPR